MSKTSSTKMTIARSLVNLYEDQCDFYLPYTSQNEGGHSHLIDLPRHNGVFPMCFQTLIASYTCDGSWCDIRKCVMNSLQVVGLKTSMVLVSSVLILEVTRVSCIMVQLFLISRCW